MPTIKLSQPLSKQEIRAIIEQRCPDLDVNKLGGGLSASTSPWVASMINVNKRSVSLAPMVASIPMFLLFFLIALTGVGLVLYAVLVIPKQQEVTKRVAAAIRKHLEQNEQPEAA